MEVMLRLELLSNFGTATTHPHRNGRQQPAVPLIITTTKQRTLLDPTDVLRNAIAMENGNATTVGVMVRHVRSFCFFSFSKVGPMNLAANVLDDKMKDRDVPITSQKNLTSNGETMKAVCWHGKQIVSVDEVDVPQILDDEDAIIKITSCTICDGSDGHLYNKAIPGTEDGTIMGHEGMGVVTKVGKNVQNIKVGQRVVIPFDLACGKCSFCKEEKYTACLNTNPSALQERAYGAPHAGILGYGKLLGNFSGTQCEMVRVPYADTNCLPIPDDVPDEKALYISDVLCTSLHAVTWVECTEGAKSLCVWGLGPIGLLCCRWAQIYGVGNIVAVDSVAARLQLAKDKLGIRVVDRSGLSSKEVCDKLKEIEPNGFEACIDAVGFRFPISAMHKIATSVGLETDTPEVIDECLTCVRSYGKIMLIGDYAGLANAFPVGKIMFRSVSRLSSSQCPVQKYWKYVLQCLQDGTIDPSFIVTHKMTSLDDLPRAYEMIENKEDGIVKIFCDLRQ